jgi:restriction endonuclease S subunit
MIDFVTHTIDELCEFTNGFAFKSSDYIEKSEQTIEVFRMGYIKRGGGFKEDSTPVFVPKNYGRDLSKYLLRKDDILIAMTDMKDKVAILANTARIKDDKRCVLNQRVGCLRVKDTEFLDPTFLYFYTNYGPHIAYLRSRANSGVQVNLSTSAIKECEITIPNIKVQKAIASVLGALDDKIENNRRMNETLEEMARAIFKSWFVDFDPVHAKAAGNAPAHMDADTAALFPSSFGDDGLPVGWSVGTYGDAMSIYDSKRVPLSKPQRAKKQGVFPYYGATSCMDHVDEYLFDGVYLLMGEDGSVVRENGTPFLQYVWGKFWVNNHAHVLQGANGFSTEHLFCGLSDANVTPYVTGAVQLKINQANMKRIPLVVPTQHILSAFSDSVLPFFDKRRLNFEENQTLSELRDTLLPKLMSGEIRVADAEREAEAAL